MHRKSLENINLSNYTLSDQENGTFPEYAAGIPPFLRGNRSTMYITEPWLNKPAEETAIILTNDLKHEKHSVYVQLAVLLMKGYEILNKSQKNDESLPETVNNIYFKWNFGNDFITEIALMRTGRVLWTKLINAHDLHQNKIIKFNIWAKPENELEAFVSILGGADYISLNNNLDFFFQHESRVTKTVDPLGGSFELEKLTHKIISNSWEAILKIKSFGGVKKTMESGILKN